MGRIKSDKIKIEGIVKTLNICIYASTQCLVMPVHDLVKGRSHPSHHSYPTWRSTHPPLTPIDVMPVSHERLFQSSHQVLGLLISTTSFQLVTFNKTITHLPSIPQSSIIAPLPPNYIPAPLRCLIRWSYRMESSCRLGDLASRSSRVAKISGEG